jgi:hypothetical protein
LSRHRFSILLAVLCCPALLVATASGDRLPSSIKSSSNPAASRAQIEALITSSVTGLGSDDPAVQKESRTTLVKECENHAGVPASPQYQSEYATDLNTAVLTALKNSKTVRQRVNAAVVVTEVANRISRDGGDVTPLAPSVQAFLNDKNPAVVLWGMKAAKYLLASTLQLGGNTAPLTKLIVKAAEANGSWGQIIEEAYNALTLDKLKIQNGAQLAGLVPDLLDLLNWRVQQYRNAPPPSPQAERPVTVFLSVTAYTSISTNSALQNRTLKEVGEMTCVLIKSIVNGNNSPEILDMVKKYGDAFQAFGTQMTTMAVPAGPGVLTSGKSISAINGNMAPAQMGGLCDSLVAALKAAGVTINPDAGPGAAENPSQPAIAGAHK